MSRSTIPVDVLKRMRRISLKKLIYFVEVERQSSFGRAAAVLGVSQPTLSQQIAELEAALDVSLIERGRQRFSLTEQGEFLLGRSRKILDLLTDAIDSLARERALKPLRVGIPSYMAYPVVAAVLRRFRHTQTGVFPYLAEMPAEEMSRYLNEGELDAGFLSLPTPARLNPEMRSTLVWEAPLLVCLSRRHPLAQKKVLRAQDVAEIDILLIPRDHHRSHYDFQLQALRSLNIEPRLIDTEVTNTQSQMGLASAGLGACLLSRDTIPIPEDLVLLPTDPMLCKHSLALFWSPSNRNPALELFRRCIHSAST